MDAVRLKYCLLRFCNRVILATLLASLFSCESNHRYRPIGWFRLGKVINFLGSETDLPESKLIIRRDNRGLYVMSTICTYDLTYLVRKKVGGKEIYVSEYTSSTYDLDGNVLSGPAVAALPHYELKIDLGIDRKARDTLYAKVGKEVPREWRLELPTGE